MSESEGDYDNIEDVEEVDQNEEEKEYQEGGASDAELSDENQSDIAGENAENGDQLIEEPQQKDDQRIQYQPLQITKPQDQVTPDILSKHEFCLLIGKRAKMIEESNDCYADLKNVPKSLQGSLSVEQIAILELIQKKCPLLIQRKIYYDSPYCEILDPNYLILPSVCLDSIQPLL